MTNYRRVKYQGASYFFTLNLLNRKHTLLTDHIELLRNSFRQIKNKYPFSIDAIVILPEHLHCILTLPAADADYKIRWSLIKSNFSRHIPHTEKISASRKKRAERGIWQRRFWEHLIRNEQDYQRHVDYIHWNPIKHKCVSQLKDWPYSSFHSYVRRGILTPDWAGGVDVDDDKGVDWGEVDIKK